MGQVINIPNTLTLGRILLTPVIVYFILDDQPINALIFMAVAGFTDMLDGAIAKHFNMRTTVGAYLDPLADKLMLVSTIVCLFYMDEVPLFVFLAVVFRDAIIIGGAALYELVTRRLRMEPTLLSKATTTVQIFYVLIALLHMAYGFPEGLMQFVVWLTFVITVVSGVQYMVLWTLKAVHMEDRQ
ncbi:MAG: CDP-diacylglycerol--glycerol-3-phosphate 3-phosphatidyltransferase [Zetaproteobacteria bacterium CG06_land_8_20_14_3_00_59_53]|nr:MAG: CDP-diacylglycerol--glycerol-3-phosphate 3-phosphatidyltransferase [Zetaproteobacteria bacterium CG2_30_59_37]PIO89520.1 MAG: CDP-diacylglycerol--glycerol-3-phosphate 3-phosphatidyltransferase [Zetaproteobacteria bacterium CG23_combo_of_CG06-09_8_20_14_all_59_86]PIQ65545.1 MAG: CDP-diacylglycerol--glycerol-3-phosphate 3-phosphatidyltransferase [Zetaproteobacteria bacterium CG11_big_fil_rev_8_21_14_0_20_59_439]PIU69798.1 MAG: CDP-diacylglycerol--glycerol-3-phosphate 3-phosphatidyltransfer